MLLCFNLWIFYRHLAWIKWIDVWLEMKGFFFFLFANCFVSIFHEFMAAHAIYGLLFDIKTYIFTFFRVYHQALVSFHSYVRLNESTDNNNSHRNCRNDLNPTCFESKWKHTYVILCVRSVLFFSFQMIIMIFTFGLTERLTWCCSDCCVCECECRLEMKRRIGIPLFVLVWIYFANSLILFSCTHTRAIAGLMGRDTVQEKQGRARERPRTNNVTFNWQQLMQCWFYFFFLRRCFFSYFIIFPFLRSFSFALFSVN